MAPGNLPVATSLLKNSPIFASFCGLKCAPGGMSKVPSAATCEAAESINNAPTAGARNHFAGNINPSPDRLLRSVAEGSVWARAAKGSHGLVMQQRAVRGKTAEDHLGDARRVGQRLGHR